jgi:hypothetical protein
MKLIDDWRKTWLKFWSVRLILLSAALDGVAAAVPYMSDTMNPKTFMVASVVTALAAAVARIVQQPAVTNANQ